MKKVHNFTAGPCVLPQQAIDNAIEALKDFKGTGIPVISISHRTKEWDAVMDECRALWRELLNIPEDYEILFLGGGASMGFLYVAMNFLENKAAYLETGVCKESSQRGKGTRKRIRCSIISRYCIQLYSKGLCNPFRRGLFPHHYQQHHLWY